MPDYFRFGLPLAVCIALGALCLIFALTPTTETTTHMHVIPGIEADIHHAPYTETPQEVTSHA